MQRCGQPGCCGPYRHGEGGNRPGDAAHRRGDRVAFFTRDAGNVRSAGVLVLLGTKIATLGVPNCGFCGFKDCAENEQNNGICAFNTGDLGIAVGSAVSVAADSRVDNRVFFSAGRAAVNLKTLGAEVKIAYGIPLNVGGKSIFFDRK